MHFVNSATVCIPTFRRNFWGRVLRHNGRSHCLPRCYSLKTRFSLSKKQFCWREYCKSYGNWRSLLSTITRLSNWELKLTNFQSKLSQYFSYSDDATLWNFLFMYSCLSCISSAPLFFIWSQTKLTEHKNLHQKKKMLSTSHNIRPESCHGGHGRFAE